jgi:signal peptidase I
MPTSSTTPAVSAGDHIFMEGASFLFRQPHLGEVIVFKTDGITPLPPQQFYVKRVAGRPGEHVRLADGKLFVNEKQVSLSNAFGEIVCDLPKGPGGVAPYTDLTVPADSYFVLGDNSTNSLDSRYWGGVPRKNIIGRVWFCYWPQQRAGKVK